MDPTTTPAPLTTPFHHPFLDGPEPARNPYLKEYMGKKLAEKTGYSRAAMEGLMGVVLEELTNFFKLTGRIKIPGLVEIVAEHHPQRRAGHGNNLIIREYVRVKMFLDAKLRQEIKGWKADNHPGMARAFWTHLKRKKTFHESPKIQEWYQKYRDDKHTEVGRIRAEEDRLRKIANKKIEKAAKAAADWERRRLEKLGECPPKYLYGSPKRKAWEEEQARLRAEKEAKEKNDQ